MYRACFYHFLTGLRITSRRVSSRFTETFSPGWRTMSHSGLISPKKIILVSETLNPLGLGPKAGPKSVSSIRGGSSSPPRKTSLG